VRPRAKLFKLRVFKVSFKKSTNENTLRETTCILALGGPVRPMYVFVYPLLTTVRRRPNMCSFSVPPCEIRYQADKNKKGFALVGVMPLFLIIFWYVI